MEIYNFSEISYSGFALVHTIYCRLKLVEFKLF